jgi:hypothetical protein
MSADKKEEKNDSEGHKVKYLNNVELKRIMASQDLRVVTKRRESVWLRGLNLKVVDCA